MTLKNYKNAGSLSPRHQCLEQLAMRSHQPELCEQIDIPGSADTLLYRDRCRASSITDIKQCSTGFHTEHWIEALKDQTYCIGQIAQNTKDASVCQLTKSKNETLACQQAVHTAITGPELKGGP